MYVVRHVLHVVPAQSELGGRDPYFFVFVFLFPKKKEENVVGFYPFFSPSQRNQIFSGSNNKHTHSLNLAISPFFFRLLLSKREVYKRARGPTRKKEKKSEKRALCIGKRRTPLKKKIRSYIAFSSSLPGTQEGNLCLLLVVLLVASIFFFFPL